MEEVIKYKASDGKIFDSEQDCKRYENEITISKNLLDTLTTLSSFCHEHANCDTCPLNIKLHNEWYGTLNMCFLKTTVPAQWDYNTLTSVSMNYD